ncbi:MAG: 2-hydroxyglutaryl-CoA dehydratase, partial [Clostridia bacterium]|nr:2-hydroxyglutaryl-CoA dehydratase [Clostridia bacterium]
MKIGLDIGSTTIKAVVLNEAGEIVFRRYERHRAQIALLSEVLLHAIMAKFPGETFQLGISGSAGMGLAEELDIDFLQEVYATRVALKKLAPAADVALELGGEDAKILFLTGAGGLEVRMNGTCAGGTGAFIDQMATLMDVPVEQLESLSRDHERSYSIASRCGVFAKSDLQPLRNQGARKEDVARSIVEAVAGQTIAGLAQGREIAGTVVYLGGPLTFFGELRDCFDKALGIRGIHPADALYSVAMGAAMQAGRDVDLEDVIARVRGRAGQARYAACAPLFDSKEEYEAFRARHDRARVETVSRPGYDGKVYIGIDSGSTTIKAVAVDGDFNLLKTAYMSNQGNPLPAVREFLTQFYAEYPDATVAGAGATGYGEALIKTAFRLDCGVVETMAHLIAARHLQPGVDFIIDIGGQDIKCFKIKDDAIDDIFLNEACSSGCGSFIQTFAAAWGLPVDEFARRGLLAQHPVDLGSRCTVFMNSSVKQAQKDGATLEDISAGLSISIVKNALYKVIRTANAAELGEHIVVQGGTFLNDAVLRAFEREIGKPVVRPNIAGLMGAYGVAVWSARRSKGESTLLTAEELNAFTMQTTNTRCQGCKNHCMLNIIRFDNGRRFISGNRCEKMTGGAKNALPNLYEIKRQMLREYAPGENRRGRVGIPMGLNMYELYPFWHKLFTQLGFEVVQSPESAPALYAMGQRTIPS